MCVQFLLDLTRLVTAVKFDRQAGITTQSRVAYSACSTGKGIEEGSGRGRSFSRRKVALKAATKRLGIETTR